MNKNILADGAFDDFVTEQSIKGNASPATVAFTDQLTSVAGEALATGQTQTMIAPNGQEIRVTPAGNILQASRKPGKFTQWYG